MKKKRSKNMIAFTVRIPEGSYLRMKKKLIDKQLKTGKRVTFVTFIRECVEAFLRGEIDPLK